MNARELMQKKTKDIKNREAALLERSCEEIQVDGCKLNVNTIQGKVQPTFRKNYD